MGRKKVYYRKKHPIPKWDKKRRTEQRRLDRLGKYKNKNKKNKNKVGTVRWFDQRKRTIAASKVRKAVACTSRFLNTDTFKIHYTFGIAIEEALLHFFKKVIKPGHQIISCLLYTSPSPRDRQKSRMPSSA